MAFGVLEDSYKKDMSVDEAKRLVIRAIKAAIERDIASGGSGIDVVVIDSKGFHSVSEDEIKKFTK
jgi:proteasome beta subunit